MFAAMMKKVMYPNNQAHFSCCGKGGAVGRKYMMEHAIEMLKLQGHDGSLDTIMMIGDRFDTDIRAGRSCGIKTCLVESGCHQMDVQPDYASDRADFFAADVSALVPTAARRAEVLAMPALEGRWSTEAGVPAAAVRLLVQAIGKSLSTGSLLERMDQGWDDDEEEPNWMSGWYGRPTADEAAATRSDSEVFECDEPQSAPESHSTAPDSAGAISATIRTGGLSGKGAMGTSVGRPVFETEPGTDVCVGSI
jgi:hypothetical protein